MIRFQQRAMLGVRRFHSPFPGTWKIESESKFNIMREARKKTRRLLHDFE
jgi:hypothetical protein